MRIRDRCFCLWFEFLRHPSLLHSLSDNLGLSLDGKNSPPGRSRTLDGIGWFFLTPLFNAVVWWNHHAKKTQGLVQTQNPKASFNVETSQPRSMMEFCRKNGPILWHGLLNIYIVLTINSYKFYIPTCLSRVDLLIYLFVCLSVYLSTYQILSRRWILSIMYLSGNIY